MTLQELKKSIEDKNIDDKLVIFVYSDSDFIAHQYIHEISLIKNLSIEVVDNVVVVDDIFGTVDNNIKIYATEMFDSYDDKLLTLKNHYIICKKLSDDTRAIFSNNIVEIPKLESWQIKDYVYSLAEGVDTKYLDNLIEVCHNDINRINQELGKISIFPKERRKYLFEQFIQDDVFNDLSKYNIFNFTSCIIKKDFRELANIYKEIENCDVEPMGFLTTLINNFRNIISIQLGNNPTADSLGMKPGQFWAIKYSCGFYNKEQLVYIYQLLTDIDRKIKTGEFPVDILIDYLTTQILSV